MLYSTRTGFFGEQNRIAAEIWQREAAGLPSLNLSQSNPTRTGLGQPLEILNAFSNPANLVYDPDPHGLLEARRVLSSHLGGEGKEADPSRLFLCSSTSEAYSYLFKLLCDPGDAILVPKPGYPLFEHLSALESVEPLGYRLEYSNVAGRWVLDLSSIEGRLRSEGGRVKAIVLINPNNPTGSYISAGERDAVVAICEKFSLQLVVDEVFFNFELSPKSSPLSFYGERRVPTFVLDGLSKRLCLPQMKLGWIAVSGPREDVDRACGRLEIIADSYLSAGAPAMNALGPFFSHESQMRARVKSRMREVYEIYRKVLGQKDSPHTVLACEGGWTALVRSPRFETEEELALMLLREEGIYAQPGYFFDMENEAHFAFSLILDPADALDAATRYGEFFSKL